MTKQKKIEQIFIQKDMLNLDNKTYLNCLNRHTEADLKEDLGTLGDITSKGLIKKKRKAKAVIQANSKGIVAGLEEARYFLEQNKLKVKLLKKDGVKVGKGDKILTITGDVNELLKTERIALNLMARMSGVATATIKMKVAAKGKVLICPTRKTLWTLLDKKAAIVGGGGSHRLGLNNFVLIKDNHLDLLKGNIDKALTTFERSKKIVEIEVEDSHQALEAALHGPDVIMFDNFKAKKIRRLISKLNRKVPDHGIIFEASGGITRDNIKKYANCGVDVISMGAITMSAPAVDFSLYFI
ncbi:MAG: carboxylating nicotinate-nucleotide diphosphorylase [Patescibacteria group bacterium]